MIKNSFINLLLDSLYPRRCAICDRIIPRHRFLCSECISLPERTQDNLCIKCGLSKDKCRCKKEKPHYSGIISPFEYKGKIRETMLRFKFNNAVDYADFLAFEMANTVMQKYQDIEFDAIAYVPMTKKKRLKRGYNQCEILAKRISKYLSVPVIKDAIIKVRDNDTQHSLNREQRFENVRNLFNANNKVNGKTILLVDDIKSTGATLDACARELALSGADGVYCVVAMLNAGKNDNKLEK